MKCAKASKYVGAFVDDEVNGRWLQRALIRHWQNCKVCQRMVEIQREMKELLQTKCEAKKAPDELKSKIHHLITGNE
jgi:mycothiol system anti-sigma-R factor